MEANYGFIGLGAMGYPMAKNIRQKMDSAGTLWIYDVNKDACAKFARECSCFGPVEIASSAKKVAENALTLASIVPAGSHVRQVYLDPSNGVVAAKENALDKERVYVECSTIDAQTAVEVGEELQKAGMGQYVDCPVSGGVPAAEQGTLSMLIGSAGEVVEGEAQANSRAQRIHNITHWVGSPEKQFYCGGLGLGLAAKICNNYLSCTLLLTNAEAMATGVKLGLDPKLLHKVIAASTGQNFMMDNVCPVPGVVAHAPSSNGYALGFKAQMMSKDVGLGVNAANSVGIEPTIGKAAIAVYDEMAKDDICIDHDGSIVYRFIGGPDKINNSW